MPQLKMAATSNNRILINKTPNIMECACYANVAYSSILQENDESGNGY